MVVERLAHPDVDETGFLKKGTLSRVQRQYIGTAGRVDNAQVGVFLFYASLHRRALIDRRLCLPRSSWCADRDRCDAAGVSAGVGLATKPTLAAEMVYAVLDRPFRPRGRPPMRCTALNPRSGRGCAPAGSATCWQWPVASM